jgi:hypothetical protein
MTIGLRIARGNVGDAAAFMDARRGSIRRKCFERVDLTYQALDLVGNSVHRLGRLCRQFSRRCGFIDKSTAVPPANGHINIDVDATRTTWSVGAQDDHRIDLYRPPCRNRAGDEAVTSNSAADEAKDTTSKVLTS